MAKIQTLLGTTELEIERCNIGTLPATDEVPEFLVRSPSWSRVFFSNLADSLLFFRRRPPLELTSRPSQFWPDVFVSRSLPLRAFWQSGLYHTFVIVAVWGMSQSALLQPRWVPQRNPFQNSKLTYYSVSEYLPPLDSGNEPAKRETKGEPEYAKQPIISLPRRSDNTSQTIISPDDIQLPHNVDLPNIVAWNPVPVPVPMAAATHPASQLKAPVLPVQPLAPPPDVTRTPVTRVLNQQVAVVDPPHLANAKLTTPADILRPAAVEPPPTINQGITRYRKLPTPAVIEPAPSLDSLKRKVADINIARLQPAVAVPRIPVPEQRSAPSGEAVTAGPSNRRMAGGAELTAAAQGAVVPPPPTVQGTGNAQSAAGKLVALGIHPAPVAGPINVPAGNRSGTFAATPNGKPGAPGTPDIHAGGNLGGGGGKGGNGHGNGSSNSTGPNGVSVGHGPNEAHASSAAGVIVSGPAPAPNKTFSEIAKAIMTSRPNLADIPRQSEPAGPKISDNPKVIEKVFAGKKYYSMMLNMPNISSVTGSWVIRFAELHERPDSPKGDVTAPVATRKVDPAYPSDLLRDRVEGTVILYAVIRADGNVGEVRILQGVEGRLDENARIALTKWHFQPGTKNGSAIDLEAVVQVPFVAHRVQY